jgi:prepilin-type N-terminal cleavage/methylation domain-containing protein
MTNLNTMRPVRSERGARGGGRRRHRRGFTLAELLVVMGLLGLLSVLTAISVKKITGDAKLSSATNVVTAALSNARAYAMKNNKVVMVVFRPSWNASEPSKPEVMEVVLAEWTGRTYTFGGVSDGFVPIPRMAVKTLPPGIRVAGPMYEGIQNNVGQDEFWYIPTNLKLSDPDFIPSASQRETVTRGSALIGVMYAADGTTITQNPKSDSVRLFVDFNNDGLFVQENGSTSVNPDYFFNEGPGSYADEPAVQVVPFLAIYDENDARQRFDTSAWKNDPEQPGTFLTNRGIELSQYINQFSHRVYFNRYTGVIMRQES